MPASFVFPIEGDGVPNEKFSHNTRNRGTSRPEQQVKIIGDRDPGKGGGVTLQPPPLEDTPDERPLSLPERQRCQPVKVLRSLTIIIVVGYSRPPIWANSNDPLKKTIGF